MSKQLCLCDMKPGQRARVIGLTASSSMRRRLLDIGLVKNTLVECVGRSPVGDPKAFCIRGAIIAIRADDCRSILIAPC